MCVLFSLLVCSIIVNGLFSSGLVLKMLICKKGWMDMGCFCVWGGLFLFGCVVEGIDGGLVVFGFGIGLLCVVWSWLEVGFMSGVIRVWSFCGGVIRVGFVRVVMCVVCVFRWCWFLWFVVVVGISFVCYWVWRLCCGLFCFCRYVLRWLVCCCWCCGWCGICVVELGCWCCCSC